MDGDAGAPTPLFTENETNFERVFDAPNARPYVKDAFHDYVIGGTRDAVNPAHTGSKAALHYAMTLAPGAAVTMRLRLVPTDEIPLDPFGPAFDTIVRRRARAEADAFYDGRMSRRCDRRRARRRAPGVRGSALVEAVLPLRREGLAGRRPGPAAATARSA